MTDAKHRVAIIGCGRLGQHYTTAYQTFPDTEVVAIVEHSPERREAVGKRFGVTALYPDVNALLRDVVPDIAAIVTPTKYYKEAVIACAEAGVKGVSTDKPIAARLSDADEMVDVCRDRGVVYAGGNLMRASQQVQQTAQRLRAGEYGELRGASVHRFRGEISGGGCQQLSILRLLTDSEVDEVVAWGTPPEAMARDDDEGLEINGMFHLTNGIECPVFAMEARGLGTDIWTDEALIRARGPEVTVYKGFDEKGVRIQQDPEFDPFEWSEFKYLTGSIRSFIAAIETGSTPRVTGHDLRQALEIAIASKHSAQLGSVPVKLPLEDRSLTLYPVRYRWLGGDVSGRPQSVEEAAADWEGYAPKRA